MKDTTVPDLAVTERGGFLVLRLPAQIGWRNYAGIRDGVCRALALATGGARRSGGVVLDFGDAVLLDAAGLVLLARTETRAHLLGCPLRVVVPEEAPVRRALHDTGLAALVPVFPDVRTATAAPVPGRPPADADTTHVLDAIRALHPGDTGLSLSPGPPGGLRGPALDITTVDAGDGDHTVVHLSGTLDQRTVRRLGETLTTLVEGNLRHLMVRMGDRLGIRCDPLPILLGIRWRVAAEGGCLSLPGLPPRLRAVIDREGLGEVFTACRSL